KDMFFAMIGRANKWSAFYVIQSELIPYFAILCKFIRVNEANNCQMFFSRLKILSQSNDVNAHIGKILHSLYHFLFFFTQPKHDTAFCSHTSLLQRLQHFHASP